MTSGHFCFNERFFFVRYEQERPVPVQIVFRKGISVLGFRLIIKVADQPKIRETVNCVGDELRNADDFIADSYEKGKWFMLHDFSCKTRYMEQFM